MTISTEEIRKTITERGLDCVSDVEGLKLLARIERAEKERDALRAKIAEMERREVGFRERCTPSSPTGYSNRFPLYALPGAKGE